MNNFITRKMLPIFLFFVFGYTLQAQVLWYGDPNKSVKENFRRFDGGNFPKDYCSPQGNNKSSVDTTNDSEYGKVWRIRKPKGQKRGEFARTTGTKNSYTPNDGDLVYYGWRWKIESTPNINNGIAVWQWKTDAGNKDNTQNYPLNMGYGNGKLTLSAWGPCYPKWNSCNGSISNRKTTLWSKSIPEDTWVTFVVGIKMSRDDDKGYVEFWYNGEKQTLTNSGFKDYKVKLSSDKKRAYHKTYDGTVMYPKWGSYNGNACNFDVTTYYHEMRIGKKLSDVLNPLGGETGGGGGNPTPPATNSAPNVSFQTPSGNITVNEGYKLDAEVNASDTDGSISNVKLYINNALVRQENKAPYEWGHANSPNPNELNGLSVGTYTIKAVATDNEGTTAQADITLTVKGNGGPDPTPTPDTNCAFGAPTASSLPSFDKANYTNIFVLGNGPNLSNIRRFRINWNAGSNKLIQFAFNTANGNPSYYVDLKGKIQQNFSSSNPSVKISGSGIGVDGDYWVTKRGNDFVMASKNGSYTIYCSTSSSKPSCSGQKIAAQENEISVYPNPASESFTIDIGTAANANIEIYNITGQVVYKTATAQRQLSIRTGKTLITGLYLVRVLLPDGNMSVKKMTIK